MTSLAIPTAADPIPRDWWRDHALPAVDEMDDMEEADEARRRMAALTKYVKDRKQRFELDAGRIVAEMRIGEFLGDGKTTQGKPLPAPVQEVPERDRARFRQLATHRKLVLKLLADGIGSRKRILARLERPTRNRPVSTLAEVRHGDFREVLDDLAGSVDAIITDPPYPKEYLPLYADLSEVAARLLRPGGIAVVMIGHQWLPEVVAALGQHLEYRWVIAYIEGGSAATMHARRIQSVGWKPVLVYEKPPTDAAHWISSDVARATGGDTDPTYHGWGQNEAGMFDLIKRTTEPEWLIVDPFLGGGTTLVAAARAGRDAIGCDVDAAAVETAKERLG